MTEEVQTTNGGGQIYGAMASILADVEAIGKGRRNEQQNYAFRGIDDIYNMVHPLLSKHGVFCVPRLLAQDTSERTTQSGTVLRFVNLTMAYDFFAADGSHVTAEAMGEAMDAGDKASNKAMSAAHKYVLLQTFCIPTGDIPDADQTTHDELKPRTSSRAVKSDVPPCPDCGGQMWDNRATKKGRQPDYKCKDKGCDKAVWLDSAKPEQGLTTKESAIMALMAEAEKLLPPDSKKLDVLRGISDPDELGQKIDLLIQAKRRKEAAANDPAEKERLALIEAISRDVSPDEIRSELARTYGGRLINELTLDELVQLQTDTIPF